MEVWRVHYGTLLAYFNTAVAENPLPLVAVQPPFLSVCVTVGSRKVPFLSVSVIILERKCDE